MNIEDLPNCVTLPNFAQTSDEQELWLWTFETARGGGNTEDASIVVADRTLETFKHELRRAV